MSSRSDRAKDVKKTTQQKIEDFMDEEDIRELEESRQISTNTGFGGFGTQDDPLAQNALDDLFRPAEDTIGEQLLARMGWKKGQGIGPRILKRIDPDDPASEMREFPPEDSAIPDPAVVSGNKGLGFGAGRSLVSTLPDLQSAGQSDRNETKRVIHASSNKKGPIISGKHSLSNGFGLGSFTDARSDEEDAYELGPRVSYNKSLGKEKGTKKKLLQQQNGGGVLIPSSTTKTGTTFRKLPSIAMTLRKCHDGKLPLDGFVLANETDALQALSLTDKEYEPPEVPEGWQPAKATTVTLQESSAPNQSTSILRLPTSSQTAQSRAQLLGETPLQGKSVFDYISSSARDKLVTVSGNDKLPPGLGETPSHDTANQSSDGTGAGFQIPYLDPTTASNALSRLKKDKNPPYSDDLPKQGRYKDFLRYSSTPNVTSRVLPLRAPHHKADEDHLAELYEFTATGLLFKPVVGMLASRFTSASSGQEAAESTGDVATTSNTGSDPSTADLITRPARLKITDPAEEAARMGMFGVATRSISSFTPTRLLCKRFGIEMPLG